MVPLPYSPLPIVRGGQWDVRIEYVTLLASDDEAIDRKKMCAIVGMYFKRSIVVRHIASFISPSMFGGRQLGKSARNHMR